MDDMELILNIPRSMLIMYVPTRTRARAPLFFSLTLALRLSIFVFFSLRNQIEIQLFFNWVIECNGTARTVRVTHYQFCIRFMSDAFGVSVTMCSAHDAWASEVLIYFATFDDYNLILFLFHFIFGPSIRLLSSFFSSFLFFFFSFISLTIYYFVLRLISLLLTGTNWLIWM